MVEAAKLYVALHMFKAVSNDLIAIELSIQGENVVLLSGEKRFGKNTVSWKHNIFATPTG